MKGFVELLSEVLEVRSAMLIEKPSDVFREMFRVLSEVFSEVFREVVAGWFVRAKFVKRRSQIATIWHWSFLSMVACSRAAGPAS